MSIEMWYKRQKQKKGWKLTCLHGCLLLPSWVFKGLVRMRHVCYALRIFHQKKLTVPVISIGNIVAGGTGKTPVTMEIANRLQTWCRVGILSRGYRSHAESSKEPLRVEKHHLPKNCGDEALLFARRFPKSLVFAGKNRIRSGSLAIREGAEVLLLDDGMQYIQLKKDVEVVVIDGSSPIGEGYFLPRGFLRDDPKRLAKADLIVIQGTLQEIETAENVVASWTKAPIVGISLSPYMRNQESLEGRSVGLFCGIGNPQRFVRDVEKLKAQVVSTCFFPDHHAITPEQVQNFAREAQEKGAEMLVCTEKDFIKCPCDFSLPVVCVHMAVVVVKHPGLWEAFLQRLCNYFVCKINDYGNSCDSLDTYQKRRFHEAMA